MISNTFTAAVSILVIAALGLFLLPGCSSNGTPMRIDPSIADSTNQKSKSWFIEGLADKQYPISCSFVEFDERGDFLDFRQHLDCEERIRHFASGSPVMVVIYCHGWKNNSQSGDVAKFNAFLAKLASTDEILKKKIHVHGVYLGWRGNPFLPYIDKSSDNESYQSTLRDFDGPIVDSAYQRRIYWPVVIPETLSYWNRKNAAEDKVSGLPMARAIFTYAATAKGYGTIITNRVIVMGHSFGALMLEQSLGQAMTGALTMEWWNTDPSKTNRPKPAWPFDLVLFVNSAAPSIYAKEMRDFLKAHRSAQGRNHDPSQDAPVIISLTSTADKATGVVHPIGNLFAPFDSSLQRKYTNGIVGERQTNGLYQSHKPFPQWKFYNKTPGHQPFLVNHWIVKIGDTNSTEEVDTHQVFSRNISTNTSNPDMFLTSKSQYSAAQWVITNANPGLKVVFDGFTPSMRNSDYWIVSCDKELISSHGDVWSQKAMEMYAGLFRSAESRKKHTN